MYIRRRRLLWFIVVIGCSWIAISTYFVRTNDGSRSQQHSKRYSSHNSRSSRENSAGFAAVGSTGLARGDEFYYDDTGGEVIKIAPVRFTPRFTPVTHSDNDFEGAAHADMAEGEIELKDRDIQDHFDEKKADVWEMDNAPKSSILNWRKQTTPKVKDSVALEFAQQPKKWQTPSSDSVTYPPGNEHYIIS